jgi:RNA polymerase sigma factor (sigma-70 family)
MDAERLLLDHLALLDRIVAGTCRRHRMGVDEAEELAATLRAKLVANDYEVVRAWQGRSSFSTYLVAVVNHAFLDYRNHLWGKWRPSAQARRLGPLAVRLETWLVRDGLALPEALARLEPPERAEAEALAARLPPRQRRHVEGVEHLDQLPAAQRNPEEELLDSEREQTMGRIRQALDAALADLPPEDHMLVKLRLEDAFSVAAVARALHCDAKPLYRRFERILQQLRSALEARGWRAADLAEIFAASGDDDAPAAAVGRELRRARR